MKGKKIFYIFSFLIMIDVNYFFTSIRFYLGNINIHLSDLFLLIFFLPVFKMFFALEKYYIKLLFALYIYIFILLLMNYEHITKSSFRMLSFFAGSIFILFIDKYFYSLNDVQKYLRLFLYSSILLSIWGIINYFTDNFFWYKFTITPSFTGSELIEESASNLLRCLTTGQSMYLSIAVIIVLFGARHITNYFVLIIAPTLFLSLKRSSMIGCFGGIFVATLFYRPRVTSIIKFSFYCCFVIITVFCSLYFSGFFDTKYYHKFYESYLVEKYAAIINPSNDITSLWRMEIWSEAISKVQKSPWLGLGIGVQQTYSKSGFSHYEGLHNTYLDIAINTGLIGLVIFVSMIFIIIFKTSLSLNKQINYELKRIFSISLGCLAVTMITLFFNVGSIFNINLFFWSFLGIINKLGYLKNSDQVLIA